MLTLEQCRIYLGKNDYSNIEVEEIRENLYQFAEIFVQDFIENQRNNNGNRETNTSK